MKNRIHLQCLQTSKDRHRSSQRLVLLGWTSMVSSSFFRDLLQKMGFLLTDTKFLKVLLNQSKISLSVITCHFLSLYEAFDTGIRHIMIGSVEHGKQLSENCNALRFTITVPPESKTGYQSYNSQPLRKTLRTLFRFIPGIRVIVLYISD